MDNDVWNNTFLKLDFKSLRVVPLVCKLWDQIVKEKYFQKQFLYTQLAFSGDHWNKHTITDLISAEEIKKSFDLLDPKIFEFLKIKKLVNTHTLVWIPEKLNGQIATINTFSTYLRLVVYISYPDLKIEMSKSFSSQWVLISNDILPNSKNIAYAEQEKLVQHLNQGDYTNWRVPKLSEIFVSAAAYYFKTGKILFKGDSEMTYVNCQDLFEGCHLAFRSTDSTHSFVNYYQKDYDFIGIASLYQF